MKKERLKYLLINALCKFAQDEYEKENVLFDLDMTEDEFNELTKEENIEFVEYWYDKR